MRLQYRAMDHGEFESALREGLRQAGVTGASTAKLRRFAAEVGPRLKPGEAPDALVLADLWLASQALGGDAAALAEVDRRVRTVCRALRGRKGGLAVDVDELSQRVRERVLVGGPRAAPRLAAYTGRGALLKWLQAVAATVAIDVHRHEAVRPQADDDEDALLAVAAGQSSAESQLLRARTRRAFTQAFKAALAETSPRERTVLRMRYLDEANLEDIAALYKVHRTTVMRWLEAAHAGVLSRTRALLSQQLALPRAELDSLMRGLDVSFSERVSRLLRPSDS